MKLDETYRTRHIDYLERLELPPWRLKLYTIRYRPEPVAAALIEAARSAISAYLRGHTAPPACYYVGFGGIHAGRTANFVFADYWAADNELHHAVWISPLARPEMLERAGPQAPSVCIYDLELQYRERGAWLEHVLQRIDSPDFDGYLAARCEGAG